MTPKFFCDIARWYSAATKVNSIEAFTVNGLFSAADSGLVILAAGADIDYYIRTLTLWTVSPVSGGSQTLGLGTLMSSGLWVKPSVGDVATMNDWYVQDLMVFSGATSGGVYYSIVGYKIRITL